MLVWHSSTIKLSASVDADVHDLLTVCLYITFRAFKNVLLSPNYHILYMHAF